MLVASLIWIVRRHHVSALCQIAAAIGMTMTLIAHHGRGLGQADVGLWNGTQLTSFLILLFYIGYMALWKPSKIGTATDLTSVLCLCRVRLCSAIALCCSLLESKGCARGLAVA